MKNQYKIALSAAALLLAACTKDFTAEPAIPADNGYAVQVVAASPDTRTAFEDTESKLAVSWAKSDAIGISVNVAGTTTSANVRYLAADSAANSAFEPADPATSTAKWQDETSAHDFYAYYPYSDGSTNPAALPVSVPAAQVQSRAGDMSHLSADFLWAASKNRKMPEDKKVAFVFNHPAAILAIDITTDKGRLATSGIIVRCTDSNEAIAASGATIDITADAPAIDCSAAQTSNEIRLSLGQQTYFTTENIGTLYVQILPGHAGKTLQVLAITDEEGEVLLAEKTIKGGGIPAGSTATLSITAEGSDIEIPTLIDLSQLGTANCYVVNTPDMEYKFRADVMGNGATTPNITPATLAPAAVRLYKQYIPSGFYKGGTEDGWSDDQMNKLVLRQSVTLEYEEGVPYVHFKTPASDTFSAGNALICATDEENNIIWSWHLWVTPDWRLGKDDVTLTANEKCAGTVMMNRNLGALSSGPKEASAYDAQTEASAAVGLAYQWGRKDPFVYVGVTQLSYNCINGYIQDADGTVRKIRNDGEVYGVWFNADPVVLTESDAPTVQDAINKTIANPNVRYKCYANAYANPWAATKANAQQDDLYKSLWGNSTRADALGSGVKTIYDPCPVGYRVPDQNAFGFFTNDGTVPLHKNDMVKDDDEIWRLNFDKSLSIPTKGASSLSMDFSASYGYHFYIGSTLTAGQTDADRTNTETTFFPAYQHIYYADQTRRYEKEDAFSPKADYMGHHIYTAVNKAEWDYPSGMFFSAEATGYVFAYSCSHFAAGAMSVRCIKE